MTCWLCRFEATELNAASCKNGPCRVCLAIANMDEEINQAVATLRRLLAKRCDLLSERNGVHDPIHRLPVELRNYTFEMVLPKQDQWGKIVGRPSRIVTLPSRLASICRSWRDIAWSNPALWSTIRIVTRRFDPSSCIPFVQNWILRSRTLPLINVREASEKKWTDILDVITPSANRWQSLSLTVPPKLLHATHQTLVHHDRLRRFQIIVYGTTAEPVTFLNRKMSPEEIYIDGLSFQALQISWNHLTSASVNACGLEDVAQLFQHASRMTYCHISTLRCAANHSIPPIIHQSLKVLRLSFIYHDLAATLFGCLTLPNLQEFHVDGTLPLTPAYLPALMHRSSSSLTSISLLSGPDISSSSIDIIMHRLMFLLEEEHYPDLRYLTLELGPFLVMWKNGFIHKLLDRRGPRPNSPNEGRLHKLLVLEEDRAELDDMWNSDVGEQLKAFNIRLREDGFEIS